MEIIIFKMRPLILRAGKSKDVNRHDAFDMELAAVSWSQADLRFQELKLTLTSGSFGLV